MFEISDEPFGTVMAQHWVEERQTMIDDDTPVPFDLPAY
jgi:hypothetical protein